MTEFELEIRDLIIKVLLLEDVQPEDIEADTRLFEEDGLGLDSIDSLEIGVALQKTYGVKINPDEQDVAAHFMTVRALASFVSIHRHPSTGA